MPEPSKGLRIDTADHTWDELNDAFLRAHDVIEDETGVAPISVAIDARRNRLDVVINEETLEAAEAARGRIQSRLGVPLVLRGGAQGSDAETCGNGNTDRPRTNCWDPLKAGGLIWQFDAPPPDEYKCTMGFHLTVSGGSPVRQFLTAGHCGYVTSPNKEQYHSKYYNDGSAPGEKIGLREATLYNTTDHRDIMRVGIGDSSQVSNRIYGSESPHIMLNEGDYQDGDLVCASLGVSDEIDCGFIFHETTSWQSETYNPGTLTVYGASTQALTILDGDSGSPVYRKSYDGSLFWRFTPLGIVNHEPIPSRPNETMYFAKVKYALAQWSGVSIYQ